MAVKKVKHGRGFSYELTTKIDGKVIRRRFKTVKEANDEYARLRGSFLDGSYIPSSDLRMTLDTYAATWFETLRVRESTYANYDIYYRKHISPVLGNRPMSRLRRTDILLLVRTLEDKGLKPSTVRSIYNIASMILRSAVYDRKILVSPCFKISLPEIDPRTLAVFTPDQVRLIIDTARPQYRAALVTAFGTGLRQAEVLGLTIDNVNLLRRELYVEQQLLTPMGPGAPYLTPKLKTKASRRVVPLPQFVIDALAAHIATYGVGPDGLLFRNTRGTGWRRGSFNDSVWKPTLRRAGLDTGYGMHATRHTYASTLIAQGQHPRVIQARLGHKSIVETMDTYGHLFPDAHDETARALDAAFGIVNVPTGVIDTTVTSDAG